MIATAFCAKGEQVCTRFGITPLIAAAYFGNGTSVKTLLALGANPNAQSCDKGTPLIYTALSGDANCGRILLAYGAYVNARDHAGRTALDIAVSSHRADIGKLFRGVSSRHAS